MIELYIILIFMIIGAIVAVEMKDMLSSVIAMGAVGLGLSIAFLVLKAPDLAITQLVIEILALIILIRTTIRKDLPLVRNGRWMFNTNSTFIFVVVFLIFGFFALKELPVFGYPIMKVAKTYLETGVVATKAVNIVSSVVLDFRAYDTLGEITVLFTAVIGVLAVVRKIGRKLPEEPDREDG